MTAPNLLAPVEHERLAVPAGFEPMPPFGPFHELVGPIFIRRVEGNCVTGLRMQEKHRNLGDMMHGGMVAMLIDTAFIWSCKHARQPALKVLTTQLSINLMGQARPGEWVEAKVDVLRAGKRMVFAACDVRVGTTRIAQASGQFQVMGQHDT